MNTKSLPPAPFRHSTRKGRRITVSIHCLLSFLVFVMLLLWWFFFQVIIIQHHKIISWSLMLVNEDHNSGSLPVSAPSTSTIAKRPHTATMRTVTRTNDRSSSSSPTFIHGTKLPVPILVLSLPKSGTTSTWRFFECGAVHGYHHFAQDAHGRAQRIADCMYHNQQHNQPLLQGCSSSTTTNTTNTTHVVWSDMGIPKKELCFYPSIDALQEIARDYPYATVLLVHRNPHEWYRSVSQWAAPGKGPLTQRWRKNCPQFPNFENDDEKGWVEFYKNHSRNVRQFAQKNPTLTFLEVSLESRETASILETETGIEASCWGNCLPSERKCRPLLQDGTV